jgi:DNA-binding response OmpR family regulator
MTQPTTNRGRILLVEDDESLRANMLEGLTEEGYSVTSAASAEEALEHLGATRFDLLITDYRLSGATGTWLARVAARSGQHAAPRVLLVTGYRDVPDAQGIEVVQKPFDYNVLLAKIEQVLGARAQATQPSPHPAQRIAFTLYVNDAAASVRATKNLRTLIRGYQADQIALTVVDLVRSVDHQAEEDRIVVTPTLVKTFPAPRTWIIGDLERTDVVERVLAEAGVERAKAATDG